MKRMMVALFLCLSLPVAWAQQVWKCETNGQVRFSDKPCPNDGRALPADSLKPNVADGVKPEAARAAIAPASAPAVPAPVVPAGNVCPGDAELRDMRTRANSTTLGDAERQFLEDEARRVDQCRRGQGRYTDADWAVSRDAQALQTRISDREREAARRRAEAMHTAADPEEGGRIERRRLADERLQHQKRQQQRQLLRAQNPASGPIR